MKSLNFYDDLNAGFNHFFVDDSTDDDDNLVKKRKINNGDGESIFSLGNTQGGVNPANIIVPDGMFTGQTLSIRKTPTTNFKGDIIFSMKNQDLSNPNIRSSSFIMTPNCYFCSWCWDGSTWYLESGRCI